METEKIYTAICGSPDSPLKAGNIEIQCYILEGGIRVLSGRGIQKALSMGQRHGTLLRVFGGNKKILPFISDKLAIALKTPYRFIRPGCGGKTALGYEATILVDLCEIVLKAREEGLLPARWNKIALQCEILMRSFAKVGIISLVDEATGYQKIREKDALAKLLAVYLSEERLGWAKRFPDKFYEEIYRLNKWNWPPSHPSKRPGIIGLYTNEVVYERLPEGVLDKLKELNPSDIITKRRKFKHHEFLTPDIGQPDLQNHLMQVIALMRAARSWKSFIRLIDRSLPKGRNYQLELPID